MNVWKRALCFCMQLGVKSITLPIKGSLTVLTPYCIKPLSMVHLSTQRSWASNEEGKLVGTKHPHNFLFAKIKTWRADALVRFQKKEKRQNLCKALTRAVGVFLVLVLGWWRCKYKLGIHWEKQIIVAWIIEKYIIGFKQTSIKNV